MLTLSSSPTEFSETSAGERPDTDASVGDVLDWCIGIGRAAPRITQGRTRELWDLLAVTAASDVTRARILEPHLDALDILHQAGIGELDDSGWQPLAAVNADAASSWGVFAAEGPGVRLTAQPDAGDWSLSGTKPWCSLAGDLSHALVTAWVDDTHRSLFAVDLRSAGVSARSGPWFARGLTDVVSAPVDFDRVRAVAVGEVGWYLQRPGFAWGGMSVAACWWGGAVGLMDAVKRAAGSERADQVALVHLGTMDAALWAARATLGEAADLIDRGASDLVGERLLADRVRAVAYEAATLALAEADAALGPAPLVSDRDHARRVADLHLYLRQHHGLRDKARLGGSLVRPRGT